MKKYFKAAGVFARALPHFLLFELMYKLILLALGTPFITELFSVAMKASGVSYLSLETLPRLLKNPITILSAIIMLFMVAFFSFVEISALIACFSAFRERRKITVTGMLSGGILAFAKAFRGTGILRFLLFMLVIPLVQFTMSSGIFFAPLIPLLRSLLGMYKNWVYIALYIALQLGLIFLLVSRCYSIHYLMLTDTPFQKCSKKSQTCLEGKKLRTALYIILWSLGLIIIAAAITFALSFLIVLIVKGFSKPDKALHTAMNALSYAGRVYYAISAFFAAPMILCCLTEKFYNDTSMEEHIPAEAKEPKKLSKPVRIIAASAAIALSIFLNFSYIQEIYKGNVNLNLGILTAPQITAHRGFSTAAPENTRYAFEEAINVGADYIELDVQQTADGQIVVFHDKNLSRTTDGTGELSAYTYDQLMQFSNGGWFDTEGTYADSRIMLLSEVFDLVGHDIMLNIEIKNIGDTADTAQKIAVLLEEYEIADSCYVTSFDYSALKEVKLANPEIKTGLITNAASAAVYSKLKYIDAVSLNYLFVNRNLVSTAHKNGKKVFVWTVNKAADIQQLLAMGVDNIITDRPDRAAEVIYSYSGSDAVLTLLRQIFGTQ